MAGTRPALPDATTDSFLSEALSEANAYRAKHHAPPLTMDAKLVEYAKSRAASRSEYEKLSAGHDGLRDGTGENIYWGAGSAGQPKTAADAVTSWYNEITNYNWDDPPGDFARTGHFSQLVWKGTTRVGAARVAGQGTDYYETYIVFVFEPPGNYEGQYRENVLKA
ncbi:CAP family protein [Actinomadura sp. ATCC 31491]|uniref:CAP family protein n=1 Tax=Actinomadura luzonensis TaxID=2805427 RepID=A0ABT0GB69_9ACTN|nr:CAP family protein [Actinomadura luzonensis]MCK2221338.1 CAP family protein [Actinomadura luzonensis]